MNYAFYVSGKAGRLRKILSKGDLNFLRQVKVVIVDNLKNGDLTSLLEKYDIKLEQFDYHSFGTDSKTRNAKLSDKMLNTLQQSFVDYVFCFGDHILCGELLTVFSNRIVNFHPSLLPLFPGRLAIDQALNANAPYIGNTAHFINEGIDTGPVILQSVVHRNFFNDFGYEGVLDIQIDMLETIYSLLEANRLNVIENIVFIKNADYHKILNFPFILH